MRARDQRNSIAEKHGLHEQANLVDEIRIEHRRIESSAADEPDWATVDLTKSGYDLRRVIADECH
jgi:hypothetical protein